MIPDANVWVFRQILYKVLVDQEVWSQHSTDETLNMVSPKNKYFLSVVVLTVTKKFPTLSITTYSFKIKLRLKHFSKFVANALTSESNGSDPNILIYSDDIAIYVADFKQFLVILNFSNSPSLS